MENASKALMMGASVLMALIVISALFLMFRQISSAEQTVTDIDELNKATEFSNQFEQYNRVLYGSELLSLANLQEDYNLLKAEDRGYTEVNIYVTIKTAINENGRMYLQLGRNKNISEISTGIIDGLENDIEYYEITKKYTDKNGRSRTVKEYSQLSNREIANLFGETFHSDDMDYDIGEKLILSGSSEVKNLIQDITKYENIKTSYVQLKTTQFKCNRVEYDNQTGNVARMYFEEL